MAQQNISFSISIIQKGTIYRKNIYTCFVEGGYNPWSSSRNHCQSMVHIFIFDQLSGSWRCLYWFNVATCSWRNPGAKAWLIRGVAYGSVFFCATHESKCHSCSSVLLYCLPMLRLNADSFVESLRCLQLQFPKSLCES